MNKKEQEYEYTLKDDIVFKIFFGKKENERFLKSFQTVDKVYKNILFNSLFFFRKIY
jgi:hypothetical protein